MRPGPAQSYWKSQQLHLPSSVVDVSTPQATQTKECINTLQYINDDGVKFAGSSTGLAGALGSLRF